MKVKRNKIILNRPVQGMGFFAPAYSKWTWKLVRLIGKTYMKGVEGMATMELRGEENLIQAFKEFQEGESRVIFLFRHPARQDPPAVMFAFMNLLPRIMKKKGIKLAEPPNSLILYGKDVLNWAGLPAVLVFPRLGYIPVQNLGINKEGMNLLRQEMREGRFPLALAPEGQVSYHSQECADLAAGFVAMAGWGLESGQDVKIVPLTLGYRYGKGDESSVLSMIKRWEIEAERKLSSTTLPLKELLLEATEGTIEIFEDFYKIQYADSENLKDRLSTICETGLQSAESSLNIKPQGTTLDRVFKIRYACTDRFYPEKIDPKELSPLKRNLGDYAGLEAQTAWRHQQIVDLLEYVNPDYIEEDPSIQRMTEYILNLLDALNRLKGGDISSRYFPKGFHAVMEAGEAISAGKFLNNSKNRKKARQDLADSVLTKLRVQSKRMIV